MKKWMIFALFLNVVLIIIFIANYNADVEKESQQEYVVPKGYKRLVIEKERYMLGLMNVSIKEMRSWRVYANTARNFIYYRYKDKKWIRLNSQSFVTIENMALYNAFGVGGGNYRYAFYSASGEMSPTGFPPPLGGMEETWRTNKRDFDQGLWFRKP